MNKAAWIEFAIKSGFESFEICQSEQSERTCTWYEHQLDSFVTSRVVGTAMRGVYGSKMVYYATEAPDDADMENIIAQMKDKAASITSDDVESLRSPQETVPVICERKAVRPSMDEIRQLLSTLEEKIASYDPRILQVTDLIWSEELSARSIVNSNGIAADDRNDVFVLYAGVAAGEGENVRTNYRLETLSDIHSLDIDDFVRELCGEVLFRLSAKPVPSGTYPVILEHDAMSSLFEAFSDMFSGDLVGKGISPLRDKRGEKIFSDKITIVDNPRNTAAPRLFNYDDEGCPTGELTLVKGGVLTAVLHNTRSGARMGENSTGNGFRNGWASVIDVKPMNCCIEPGTDSLDQMIRKMGEGIVVTELAGLHAGLDSVTGDFSLQCQGYLVKDGKKERSVNLITIAGNFLDLMKQVDAVGSDLVWKMHTCASPSIAFTALAVSGE